ncbi:MAG: hypothetical protein GX456_07055 [Verrucomicrobia bacterium]|nr:hypothetical protein [Verrucomicrobiota bacterium]
MLDSLFKPRKERIELLKGQLIRAERKLDRKIGELGARIKKDQAQAVAFAKSGEKHRTAACVQRIHKVHLFKRGVERRRDMLENWVVQIDAASTDEEVGVVLNKLAGLLKVPPSRLPDAIDKFTTELEFQQTDSESAWKDAEAQQLRQAEREFEEGIPTEDEIMADILSQAGAERETEARKATSKQIESDETADLRARIRRITEGEDK